MKPKTRRGTPCWAALLYAIGLLIAAKPGVPQSSPKAEFVGSAACRPCHQEQYDGWKQTRMANVVRDPKLHPDAVLGDFTHSDPVRSFDLSQVAFVYGSRWKQRYFTRRGDDYYPLPAQWDIKHGRWLPYHVATGTDWWVPHYGDSNFERPTGPLCDGCHSVNYNIETRQVTEWNVGCEKCHGPGSLHVAHPKTAKIVNPERLDWVRGNDVCIQCHSQGQAPLNPIKGRYYDWPVGFLPGERLADYWNLEDHRLGATNFFYWADASAHKNRMQGNDFVQSVMYHRQVRCFDCHQVHSNQNPSNLGAVGNQLCITCHTPQSPAGPHSSIAEHTHHKEGSAGAECTACHMPKIAVTLGDNFVSSHTFRFTSPKLTEQYGIPNPCTTCHADKSTKWALSQLNSWQTVSPWSVAQ